MKESDLETQLRSWRPRPASPKIKEGLFPTKTMAREFASVLRWIAPTAACGLLAVAVFRHDPGLGDGPPALRAGTLVASNQITHDYGSEINQVNRLSGIFEWTNRSGSAFSKHSFLPGKAN